MIEAYFDGACEPNPGGHTSYGIYIVTPEIKLSRGGYVGQGEGMSNNTGEYAGFIYILKTLKERGLCREDIVIRGDSKLVIEQMKGKWDIVSGVYVPYALKARELLKDFKQARLEWLPREQNKVCDIVCRYVLRGKGVTNV